MAYNTPMCKKIHIIAGPTASGKSSFSIRLAKDIKGEIINADSLQIYKDLSILTARPSSEDIKICPHHLYGFLDAYSHYSVAQWLKDLTSVIDKIENPIIVGGTGMYIYALMNGLCVFPEIPEDIRQHVRNMDIEEVKKQIKKPTFHDPQRLRRALEVELTTHMNFQEYQQQNTKKFFNGEFHTYLIMPNREKLYQNCTVRLEHMFKEGAIEEVKKLQNLHPTGSVLNALGVQEISDYLDRKITLNEAYHKTLLSTKHYAKRQCTWFRNKFKADIIITDL